MSDFKNSFMVDGPLMSYEQRRAEMILQMAAILLEEPAYVERGDAIRCLHARGYNAVDVMMLTDDARLEAHQQLIAKVISDE
jgi:hypothetical protein